MSKRRGSKETVVREINCPSCNTKFSADDAPWLKQAEYCPKHDRTRLAGTTCEFCDQSGQPEVEKQPEVEETEAQAKA